MKMMSLESTRLGGIILALALSLGLAGCSAVKLGYNTLPDLVYWWLDGYVDFSEAQAPRARQEIARLHAWHRQQELPRLAEVLARMEQLAGGEIGAQQACGVFNEVRGRLNAVAEQAEPSAVAMAATLTPRQLRHLERKFRRNNENFFKEWIAPSPDEQHEKFFDQSLDRIETIYGRLEERQKAVLRQAINQSMYEPPRVLAERQRRQQDLLQVLKRTVDPSVAPAEARALLRGWLDRAQHSPDLGFRAWQEALVQEGCRTFAAVHASTTPAQRQQAGKRLRAYQRDLRDLALQQR